VDADFQNSNLRSFNKRLNNYEFRYFSNVSLFNIILKFDRKAESNVTSKKYLSSFSFLFSFTFSPNYIGSAIQVINFHLIRSFASSTLKLALFNHFQSRPTIFFDPLFLSTYILFINPTVSVCFFINTCPRAILIVSLAFRQLSKPLQSTFFILISYFSDHSTCSP